MYTRPVLKEILVATAEITSSTGIDQLSKHLDSRVTELARKIWTNPYRSDEQLMDKLVDINNKKRLSEQKGLLFQELGNLMLGANSRETALRNYRDCHNYVIKWHAIFQLMAERKYFHAADYIGNRLLSKARLIGAYQIEINVIRFQIHLATLNNSERKLKKLHRLYAVARKHGDTEEFSKVTYYEVLRTLNSGDMSDPKTVSELNAKYQRLIQHRKFIKSPVFQFYLIMIEFMLEQFGHGHSGKEILERGEQFLLSSGVKYYYGVTHIYLWRVRLALKNGQYREADEYLFRAAKYLKEGELLWFEHLELKTIYWIHTRQYRKAIVAYFEATAHEEYDVMPLFVRERFRLMSGYLYLLRSLGVINPAHLTGEFRIHKLLNDLPILSKSRSFWNIPVVIMQLMHYLADGRWKLIAGRTEATDKYLNRYVNAEANRRSRIFIKLLLDFPKKDWNKRKILRSADRKMRLLNTRQANEHRYRVEWEIVPFDLLWELIADHVFIRRAKELDELNAALMAGTES